MNMSSREENRGSHHLNDSFKITQAGNGKD